MYLGHQDTKEPHPFRMPKAYISESKLHCHRNCNTTPLRLSYYLQYDVPFDQHNKMEIYLLSIPSHYIDPPGSVEFIFPSTFKGMSFVIPGYTRCYSVMTSENTLFDYS